MGQQEPDQMQHNYANYQVVAVKQNDTRNLPQARKGNSADVLAGVHASSRKYNKLEGLEDQGITGHQRRASEGQISRIRGNTSTDQESNGRHMQQNYHPGKNLTGAPR